MKPVLLVIDVSYLAHRAFHTTGQLDLGVTFGFLKAVSSLKDEFQTDRLAFCFDHAHLFRRDIFPGYKAKRSATLRSPEEVKSYLGLQIQIQDLRNEHLPAIGFRNIFCIKGMESDDLMAAIAFGIPEEEEAVLVTADHDLYQCLRPNVSVFSPQHSKLITEASFTRTYKIKPRQWALVKALCGCRSDKVPGVRGVGEITALRYVRGELDGKSNVYHLIRLPASKETVRFNRRLVQLPFEGCQMPKLQEDKVDPKAWRDTCHKLGMKSLT